MENEGIKEKVGKFLEEGGPLHRYASFDHCYNYFHSFYKKGGVKELASRENMEMSCLQLGFFLASWGMMRGSTLLIQRSVKKYSELVEKISKMERRLWEIDVPDYDGKNIAKLLKCRDEIAGCLEEPGYSASDTLATKIMLGVFANVPALDSRFSRGFFEKEFGRGCKTLNKRSLGRIHEFYLENRDAIDSVRAYTFDFRTSRPTKVPYTKAKIIDMYGFMNGGNP